jgi:hypothetical protein
LKSWSEHGAELAYFTPARKQETVEKRNAALKKHGFPEGPLYSRGETKSYAEAAQEIQADVIVEDDCESIGG